MPFCPMCKVEYIEGVTRCPDCDVELVPELPTKPEPATMDEEMVPFFGAKDEYEAKIVKGVLEEAGIPVWEKADIVKFLDPFTVGPLGEEVLAVPESRVEEARAIIAKALEAGKNDLQEEE